MPERDYIERMAQGRYKGEIQNAVERAIAKSAAKVNVSKVEALIKEGKIEAAVEAGMIDPAILDKELRGPVEKAFNAGGNKTADLIPPLIKKNPGRIKVEFNPGSRRAVNAVDNLHFNKIRDISGGTREAIRGHIQNGLETGKNPLSMARQIRGKYDRVAKQYTGGVLGLTGGQNQWVNNAEAQLRSGNPTEMRKYLSRKLRDKRYDRSVLKAINEKKALTQAQVNDMTHAYRRKAIKYRSETIARDQALEALSQGQDAALDQGVDEGVIKDQDILQFWITAGDEAVRTSHAEIPLSHREGVRRGEYFETPLGPLLRPRDQTSAGSVAANTIQCRCSLSVRVRRQPEKGKDEFRDEYGTPQEEAPRPTTIEDQLSSADVTDMKRTDDSGINESFVISLMNRSAPPGQRERFRGCFKPIDGERFHNVRRTITNDKMPLAHREVLASRVDEAMGLNMVPKTVLREVDGRMGSVQHWVEDAQGVVSGKTGLPDWGVVAKVSPDDMYKMSVFDYVIGNTDRHGKNVLFKNNRPVLIDNGFSFPKNTSELRLNVQGKYAKKKFGDRPNRYEKWNDAVGPSVKKEMKEALAQIEVDNLTLDFQMSSSELKDLKRRISEMYQMIDLDIVMESGVGPHSL